MGEIDADDGKKEVAEFAEEESESVSVEFVVNVLLEVFQHFAFLLVHVLWRAHPNSS